LIILFLSTISFNLFSQVADTVYLSDGSIVFVQEDLDLALLISAQEGNLRDVRNLIKARADINYETHEDKTPLYFAAQNGHNEIVGHLMLHGADAYKADVNGFSPIHIAVINNHYGCIEVLLKNKVNPNLYDKYLRTPLFHAIEGGNINSLKILHQYGSDFFIVDRFGDSPMHLAAYEGKSEFLKFLLEKGDTVNKKNKEGFTPLMIAAQEGKYQLAEVLLQNGAEMEARNKYNASALALAIKNGNLDIVKLFEQYNANLDTVISKNNNYLGVAKDYAQTKIFDYLKVKGVKPPRGIKVNQAVIGLESSFHMHDLMMGAYAGLIEHNYDFMLIGGYLQRYGERAVLLSTNENDYLQANEKRKRIYLLLRKQFALYPLVGVDKLSISLGAKGEMTIKEYSGLSVKNGSDFGFSPEVGLNFRLKRFDFNLNYEYVNHGLDEFSNHRIKFGFAAIIDFGPRRIKNKTFRW